jgi:hypothetical protein
MVGLWGKETTTISQLGVVTRGAECLDLPIFVVPSKIETGDVEVYEPLVDGIIDF